MDSYTGNSDFELVHVSVASPAGAYTVGNIAFFRYIVRLAEMRLPLSRFDQEALDVLAAIPHAFELDLDDAPPSSGSGWRIVKPRNNLDWPVLEATPQRLRSAFERAHRILWEYAARFPVSAREIAGIEEELDAVYAVLMRAEAQGCAVNISYTA